MASYDSSCLKTANGGYVLEAGEYTLSVHADAHTVLDEASFTVSADVDYSADGRAMNMHRTAFNGRNFEYYSEDGVLAGYIASAEVNASATKGVYAYIKHFVVNDQEINRCTAQQIHLTEQTLREIYMKPFEIVVKHFDFDNGPLAVMSSFTLIGPRYTGANSDLLNGVLRGEWGFQGMVLTDWYSSYGYQLTMEELGGMDNMTKTFLAVDIGVGVVSLGAMTIVLMRWLNKKKKANA